MNKATIIKRLMAASLVLGMSLSSQMALAQPNNIFSNTSLLVMTEGQFQDWFRERYGAEAAGLHPVSLTDEKTPIQGGVVFSEEIHDILLSAGDMISVEVFGHDDLSRTNMFIDLNGYLDMPLIGKIEAKGRTDEELQREITEKFQKYLISPHVEIRVNSNQKPTVYVMGAVSDPGAYKPLFKDFPTKPEEVSDRFFTLSEALHQAGGIVEYADLKNVHIFNQKSGKVRNINLFDLLVFGRTGDDIYLRKDDVVYVPRLDKPFMEHETLKVVANSRIGKDKYPIRIHGLVKEPDIYELKPDEMTLHSAISRAGGLLPEAQPKKVIVARTNPDGSLTKLSVNRSDRDLMLHPNDIVMVENTRKLAKMDSFLTRLTQLLMPAFQASFIQRNLSDM